MMLMINQPDIQEQEPQSGKLVLPAPPTEERQMYDGGQKAQFDLNNLYAARPHLPLRV